MLKSKQKITSESRTNSEAFFFLYSAIVIFFASGSHFRNLGKSLGTMTSAENPWLDRKCFSPKLLPIASPSGL